MAEIFTDKLKLTKRDTGDLNWGTGHNANLDLLDAHAQQGTLRPPRTLLATLGSGAVGSELLGSTVYFYKDTAINAAGETTENKIPIVLEAQVSQPVTPLPVILQWEIVKGASGYRIYKSTATGQEKFLAEVTGESTLNYTDTGNTATNNLIPVPSLNTARTSVRKIIAGSGINVNPVDGTGDVTVSAAGGGGVTSLKKTGEATALTGAVSLEQGAGMQLTQDDPNNKISIVNAGVTGLRKLGEAAPLTGDVNLEAGANITLTQDEPNNKITIAAAGGGASGYATQVVAAPTGVVATDTPNIQNALNAAASAGGGTVLLREGTYNINATLSIGTKVVLKGQGRDATVILCDPTMGGVSSISASGSDNGLQDLTVDENQPNRTGNPFSGILMNSTRPFIFDCAFKRNLSTGSFIFLGSGGQMRNCIITNDGNALSTAIVQGGELIDSCTITQNQSGNVNDFMQQPTQVVNCRLIKSQGTISGAGIRMSTSNKVAVGNLIAVGSGNNAVILGSGSTNSIVVGNILNGATILLELNAANHMVVGNANAVITDNSAASNTIADNFVTGIRKLGEASPIVGDVKLEAGANVTLTQDGPNKKITIAAAGGGGGGQTVASAVLSPTGVAATDTSNLASAISTVSGAGGGKIILRAGVFAINDKLDLPANVEIEGEGPATVIRGTSPMTGFSGRYVLFVPTGGKLSRLKLDISQITDTAFMRQAMWLLGSPVRLVEVEIECGNVGSGIDMGSGPIFLDFCQINCGTGGQAFVSVGQDIHVANSVITAVQLANNSGGNKRFHNCRLALGSVSLSSVEFINCEISDLDTSSNHLITLASGIIRDCVITTHIFNFSKEALLVTGQTIAVNNRLTTTNPGIFQTTINIQGSKNTVHGNYVHSNINLNSGAVDNIVKNNFASITDSSGQSNTIGDNRTAV